MRMLGIALAALATHSAAAKLFTYQQLYAIDAGTTGTGILTTFTRGSDGLLYNASNAGGNGAANGLVFRLNAAGKGFAPIYPLNAANDGKNPKGGAVEGPDGRLYGTTSTGGQNNFGTIFAVNKDGTGYVVLKQCTMAGGTGPIGRLAITADGTLYGVAFQGGGSNKGVVFSATRVNATTYTYNVVHNFTGAGGDGEYPSAGLLLASDGNLYGVTQNGGNAGVGTIFKIDLNNGGTYSTVKSWASAVGQNPKGALIELPDGRLAGATSNGGTPPIGFPAGIVYTMNKDGSGFQTLRTFIGSNTEGSIPVSDLTLGMDGLLYGVTESGGEANTNSGIAFRVDPSSGKYEVIYRFNYAVGAYPGCGLIELKRGVFLGATTVKGPANNGAIFLLTAPNDPPVIKYKGRRSIRLEGASVKISGTATDDLLLQRVEYKAGKAKYRPAKGTAQWSFRLKLKPGASVAVLVRAQDIRDRFSKLLRVKVFRP